MKRYILFPFILSLTCYSLCVKSQSYEWVSDFGGESLVRGLSVETDPFGYVYSYAIISGSVANPATVGPYTVTVTGMYLTKFDNDGNVIWTKKIEGKPNTGNGKFIGIDSEGNVFITGFFDTATLVIGNDTLINPFGGYDPFVVKVDSSGSILWARSGIGVSGPSSSQGRAVAVDGYGNVIMVGHYTGGAYNFDGEILPAPAIGADFYVVKYDQNGYQQWATSVPTNASGACGYGVEADGEGSVFVTSGSRQAQLIFGTDTIANGNTNAYDLILLKYDSAGTPVWGSSIGGNGASYGYQVTVDDVGNLYTVGVFTMPISIPSLVSQGDVDGLVAKFDPNGDLIWAKGAGGCCQDQAYSIGVKSLGDVYIGGYFASPTISFDTITITGHPNWAFSDAFIVKYNTSGDVLWADVFGHSQTDQVWGIAVGPNDDTYMTGFYRGDSVSIGNFLLSDYGSDNIDNTYVAKIPAGPVEIQETPTPQTLNLTVYPNPTTGFFTITGATATITVLDIYGRQVLTTEKKTIDLNSHSSGIYFVQAQSDNGAIITQKLVLQR